MQCFGDAFGDHGSAHFADAFLVARLDMLLWKGIYENAHRLVQIGAGYGPAGAAVDLPSNKILDLKQIARVTTASATASSGLSETISSPLNQLAHAAQITSFPAKRRSSNGVWPRCNLPEIHLAAFLR